MHSIFAMDDSLFHHNRDRSPHLSIFPLFEVTLINQQLYVWYFIILGLCGLFLRFNDCWIDGEMYNVRCPGMHEKRLRREVCR